MMRKRNGLNCSLTYNRGKTTCTYSVRANLVAHGMQVIYAESSARVRRVFYPHRLTYAQFALGVDLVGEDEFVSFSTWMANYADYAISLDLPVNGYPYMAVSIPSRRFLRYAVPLSGGFEWGDSVGLMLRTETVVFETVGQPGDKANQSPTSYATGQALKDATSKYFYPTGQQLSGSMSPPSATYSTQADPSDFTGAPKRPAPPSTVVTNPTYYKPPVDTHNLPGGY